MTEELYNSGLDLWLQLKKVWKFG